jgi:hypothetical protein
MATYSGFSNKRAITNGSFCYKFQSMFNNRSSLKKHHDHGSRACVPISAGLDRVAAPCNLILPLAAAHASVIGTAPAAAIGHEMSLFASAIDAQYGMSVISTEVEKMLNDFPEDDRKSAVPQVDNADVHNHMTTVGDAVHAYRFMSWLNGDEPDTLAMEDRFFPSRRS